MAKSSGKPNTLIKKNVAKLRDKLRELFQLDRGELDFGLYRIMALKSVEVDDFLENHLEQQISKALEDIDNTQYLKEKTNQAIEKAEELGVDPEQAPKVKELRAQIRAAEKKDEQIEAGIYNHLYNFFSRYYDEGDFMSLRRYKSAGRESYAIPYNGEEVKLHWANADQYYIKTTENYASYVFKPKDGNKERCVRFEIAVADNEKDNVKETNGNGRFFVLSKSFVKESKTQLVVYFEHRPLTDEEKKKHPQNGVKRQMSINEAIEKRLLGSLKGDWPRILSASCPTKANGSRTLLGKHLTAYTAKNSFDYFIHKDLGGFLRRELDYYLKAEVLSLDNLELSDSILTLIRGMAQVKAIRHVGHKIIDFIAQLEDFQKQLWLKKKFVLETQYCVTLDKVPESFYAEIAKNKAQHDEWVRLFAIDEINGDTAGQTAYSTPLKPKFLKENSCLVLDTRHFVREFVDKLLATLSESSSLDEHMDGLLVHGENFQALNLLQERYREQVKCVYIDPPYNTDASAILYKNNYKNSSWISLMENRISAGKFLLSKNGIHCTAIDDEEVWRLHALMQSLFEHELGIAVVRSNPVSRKSTGKLSPSHEYALFFGNSIESNPGHIAKTEKQVKRYPFEDSGGHYAWLNLIRSGRGDRREDVPTMFYPIYVKGSTLRVPEMKWDKDRREYKILEEPYDNETVAWPVRDGVEKRWQRGWERVNKDLSEYRVRRNQDGTTNIDFKVRLDEFSPPSTWWENKEYASSNYGPKELKNLFGGSDFDFSKALRLVEDCLRAGGSMDNDCSHILDYFAGSGTTGHAVINLNREDGGDRRYILVEIGHHFDNVLLPRIKKVVYSKDWKDGKPQSREGISQLFKYVRIESYEDTLDSLVVNSRKDLVNAAENKAFIEDYQLRYALGVETANSASLLGRDFADPFNYTLSVVRDGSRRDVKVDLAETFNFLLGLRVARRRRIDDVLIIAGTNSKGEHCLILWRNQKKMSASRLDKWFTQHKKTFGDELNLIYVNGDHTLNALSKSSDHWEAITIEPVFRRLMFEEG